MNLNTPQNILFKINSIEDNSRSLNKKPKGLIKPVLVEDDEPNNDLLKEKKDVTEQNEIKNKNIFFNPFNFNKNFLMNSTEDISYKMTLDTLTNINMTFPTSINLSTLTELNNLNNINNQNSLINKNLINLGQNKSALKENKNQKSNSKLKKKRKFNKFKVSYIEPKSKNNYKLNHKRKYKPDDIRKKIKARFHKSIKNIINENLRKAGSKYLFSFLPQIFISSISRQKNNQVLDLTYRQLLEKNFVSDVDENVYKNKKVDFSKYKNNLKVLEYLDEHPDICKSSGFDIMGNMKYKELLEQYFNSEEFDKALQKLKEENEEDEYIEEYKNKAMTYVQFFCSINPNKKDEKNNNNNEEDESKDN